MCAFQDLSYVFIHIIMYVSKIFIQLANIPGLLHCCVIPAAVAYGAKSFNKSSKNGIDNNVIHPVIKSLIQ